MVGLYLVSIMRDTWVTSRPGGASKRCNAALNYGGISLRVAAVEPAGHQIDRVAEIEFEASKALVRSVGGVDVQVPFNYDINIWSFKRCAAHGRRCGTCLHACSFWLLMVTTSVFVTSVRSCAVCTTR